MSYYVTSENSVLNINNAHLKVSGNIQTDVMKLGAIEFAPPASDVPGTVNFTNVTTGVTTSSNLNVGGTLMLGTVEVVATTHTLENTTALGNVTSNTIQFTNATTSLVASGNVVVTGNVTADHFVGDGSNITGISSTLQAITDSGPGANVTSNTVQFTNATTGFVTTANIEVGTANLFVDTSSSRIGIGTVSPDETLDVVGSMRVGGGDGMLTINNRATTYGGNPMGNETIALQTTIDGRTLAQGAVYGQEPRVVLALQPDFGYVGVGTTAPDNTLHISGTQNQLVQIQNTSDTARLVLNGSSGTGGDLIFKQAGTTTWGIASIGDSLHFLGDDSTSLKRMTINNDGIVTTPLKPAFYAWDNTTTRRNKDLNILPFDSTTYNIGSHYSTSTGRFLTPVAGTYIFAAVIVHDTANALSSPIYTFYVDGVLRRDIIEGTGSHYAHYEQHGVYIANLAANQYVDIRSRSASDITFLNGNHGAYYRNCFQGALLG